MSRNRTAFERARNIEAMIFDKTGTLTRGEFGVTETLVFSDGIEKQELLTCAASVEDHFEHPIGKGITEATDERLEMEDFGMRGGWCPWCGMTGPVGIGWLVILGLTLACILPLGLLALLVAVALWLSRNRGEDSLR